MRTGIRFFDEHEFQEGDLVVFLGGAATGKTTVATNVAVALADNVDSLSERAGRSRHVVHFDLERPREAWTQHVASLCAGRKMPLSYRNVAAAGDGWLPTELGSDVVVVDNVGLALPQESIHDYVRCAKQHAVRQSTVVVMFGQLAAPLWRELALEKQIDVMRLPQWALEFADQIHLLRRTPAGVEVHRVKAAGELNPGGTDACTMTVTKERRLQQMG